MAKIRTKRLWTTENPKANPDDYLPCEYKDTRSAIDFQLMLDRHFIGVSQRGLPWQCLLAKGVQAAAEANPTLFSHPVLHVYVEGTTLFIMTRKARSVHDHHRCVRYRHNFTKTLRKWDKFDKRKFLQQFGDQGIEIHLRPPPTPSVSRAGTAPSRSPRERSKPRVLHGVRRRAEDAGLVPPT